MTAILAAAYVAAAIAANLTVAHFGPAVVPFVAFALVGFVMTTRDRLHDAWRDQLVLRMGALIFAGSAASWLVNADAARIAVASAAAFALSEGANAAVYQPMLRRGVGWVRRVNVGNIPNALVDSIVFVTVAFGFSLRIVALQVGAKVAGGFIWSLVLRRGA